MASRKDPKLPENPIPAQMNAELDAALQEQQPTVEKIETAVVEYRPIYAVLAQAEQENSSLVFDYKSPKGNKEARSHIHKLRGLRTMPPKRKRRHKEQSRQKKRARKPLGSPKRPKSSGGKRAKSIAARSTKKRLPLAWHMAGRKKPQKESSKPSQRV